MAAFYQLCHKYEVNISKINIILVNISKIVTNKIRLLWCHILIELRLLEVEVNLSGISLTSFFDILGSFWAYCGPIGLFFGWGRAPKTFLGCNNYLSLILDSSALDCSALNCSALNCSALDCRILVYSAIDCSLLDCIALDLTNSTSTFWLWMNESLT